MPKDTFSQQTPETLKAIAEELRRVAGQYDTAAEGLRSHKIESLVVKGETERGRALRGASAFAENALIAMWEHLQDERRFGMPVPPPNGTKKKSDTVSDSKKRRTKK